MTTDTFLATSHSIRTNANNHKNKLLLVQPGFQAEAPLTCNWRQAAANWLNFPSILPNDHWLA